MVNKGAKSISLGALWIFILGILLVACGDEARPTPDYSSTLTEIASRPTPNASLPIAPVVTINNNVPYPSATPTLEIVAQPLTPKKNTPTPQATLGDPLAPLFIPTPTTPSEAVLTSDSLGLSGWSDTEINWSPKGDQFILHILRGEDQTDFYYLVRPPASPMASFKLSRTTANSFSWSADGRYLSFINQDSDGNPGPVQVIDTVSAPQVSRELFKGPCTSTAWLNPVKLVAACGTVVLSLPVEGGQYETLYRLEENRFPGSALDLALVVRALPSPDGATLALYGLGKPKSNIPVGEVAFLNLASKKLSVLNRDNRPVTIVDWTPDSKFLVLRNLTGDWSVPYTFDFYLADPKSGRITLNLTKSNDKCDPLLGSNPDCQGLQASSFQVLRLLFAPDGLRYLFSGVRYVTQSDVTLEPVERINIGALPGPKLEKPAEMSPFDKIVGATWLPDGHYFYSRSPLKGPAIPIMDGQGITLKSPALAALIQSVSTQTNKPPLKPAPTGKTSSFSPKNDLYSANIMALAVGSPAQASPAGNPPATGPTPTPIPLNPATNATPTIGGGSVSFTIGSGPVPSSTSASQPNSPAAGPTPTQPVIFPTLSSTITPGGTQIIQIYTATPNTRSTPYIPQPTVNVPVYVPPVVPNPTSQPTTTPRPSPTPATPDTTQLRPVAFYASPQGNWVISVERIAPADSPVQFQIRLVPFSVK